MMTGDSVQKSIMVRGLLKQWIDVGLPKSDLRALIDDLRGLSDILEQKLQSDKPLYLESTHETASP